MPELPEVEVTRRGIAPALIGRSLTHVRFRVQALRYPLPHDSIEEITGRELRSVSRRGKYLLLDFEVGHLLIHLGMSGSLRLVSPATVVEKHDHADLVFSSYQNGNELILRLRDPRRFGAILWLEGDAFSHPLLKSLGIEPLSEDFTGSWLKKSLAGVKTPIKPALMDSHRIVGVGNIYAAESLFRARIDPRSSAGTIGPQRLQRLAVAIKETLTAAIDAGGSSLRDFIHSDGSSGYFQQHYYAYGRDQETCRICSTPIRMIRQAQRATFFCPRCQR